MRRLINEVRRYEWGSVTAIPELLAADPDGGPQAELWLGAHSGAPSRLVESDGRQTRLDAAVAEAPGRLLGERVLARFGERLPFLLKVLAAAEPLSLQVHPDQARARAGFEAEQAAGVAIDARERNYKDPFHKPELVLALEPFEALCGFRDPAAIRRSLTGLDAELARLLSEDLGARDPSAALRAAFTRLLTLPSGQGAALIAELAQECARTLGNPGGADRNAAAVAELAQRYPADPGAVAALLLNRVTLRSGEALFLPAGNVHAYLSGTAVEIMAASDNVLRAGLTSKHIDTGELLATVDFSVLPLPYVRAVREGAGRLAYRPGIADFALHDLRPSERDPVPLPQGPAIALVLDGQAVLRTANGSSELALRRGQSAFLDAGEPVLARGPGRVVAAALGEAPPTHVTAVTPR